MVIKQFNHQYSLNNLLKDSTENLLFHIPLIKNKIHHHYSILVWLLSKTYPQKIAIFDDDISNNLYTNITEIINSFELNCQCYSNKRNIDNNENPTLNVLLPLNLNPDLLSYDLIYINSSNQFLTKTPFLSQINNNFPENTLIVIDNIFNDNTIAKENYPVIINWQTQYLYFEFFHHNGLTILYKGDPTDDYLKELFDLKHDPILVQRFQKKCAFIDHYWSMYFTLHGNEKKFNHNEYFKNKIQTNLLENKNHYLKKEVEAQQIKLNNYEKSTNELIEQINTLNTQYEDLNLEKLKNANKIKIILEKLTNYNYDSLINSIFDKNNINNFDNTGNSNDNNEALSKKISIIFNEQNKNIIFNLNSVLSFLNTPSKVPSHKSRPPSYYNPVRHVLFVAGEPETPGVIYRCYRNAEACIMAGHEAKVVNAADISFNEIQWANVIILWRVEFSGHINGIFNLSKQCNTLTAFDADDIVFKPHFAHIEIIDGIRTIGTTEANTAHTFHNMRQTLIRSDFAVATTKEMREHMAQELIPKHAGPLIFTLPNIFNDDCVKLSRFASRVFQATKNDNFIRIGYASGTRTHQRDFALVIPALISLFQQRPNVRVVLFREPGNHRPILHMNEFPELTDYEHFIEWRDTVPLKNLPQELARFDISIAPLEINNVFCNAKSELKFFEAALANVCSITSPTKPLKRCIKHGVTGFLASTAQEWETYLLRLVDDKSLRKKIAQNAYHDVLWNFSIQRQSKLCDTILQSLINEKGAALAGETFITRNTYHNRKLPIIPPSLVLFQHDNLQESEVTVIITSFNYQRYLLEALESVYIQTLKNIDLIVVDDGSTDDSLPLLIDWANQHKNRFNRLQIHKSINNVGLGGARNIGIAASETLYSMQLDADNRLMPDTCEILLDALKGTNIGYAYPEIHHFGEAQAVGGDIPFNPLRLTIGNYIDAMVLVAKWAWAAVGGFYVQKDAMGWEDYDLWCCLAEMGIAGTQVNIANAEYRAHYSSMTNVLTEQNTHKPKVVSHLEKRHPWLDIIYPEVSPWNEK